MPFAIHQKFKLNNRSFENKEALISYSKSVSTEIGDFMHCLLDAHSMVKLQTSGSTGIPKEINVKKKFMINSAKATGSFFKLNEETTALLCMNPKYVGGKMMLVRALVLGWHLDIVAPSSNPLQQLGEKYDFCAMVPLQVSHSLESLHKIKTLIIGGGVVAPNLYKKIQLVPTICYATYGMTETVSHVAVQKLNHSMSFQGRTKPTHFRLLPNITISKDQRNCLVIDAPEITDTTIITNDMVELISEVEFKWLGRFDTMINSGGIKLNPEQIEEKLSEIIKTRFFVAGTLDPVLGEKLILIVEGATDATIIFNKVKHLSTLMKYEVPKKIISVPNFIETATKKIQRKKTMDLIDFSQ